MIFYRIALKKELPDIIISDRVNGGDYMNWRQKTEILHRKLTWSSYADVEFFNTCVLASSPFPEQ